MGASPDDAAALFVHSTPGRGRRRRSGWARWSSMGATGQQRTAVLREQRRRRVLALAAEQAGVVSRRQVYAAGPRRGARQRQGGTLAQAAQPKHLRPHGAGARGRVVVGRSLRGRPACLRRWRVGAGGGWPRTSLRAVASLALGRPSPPSGPPCGHVLTDRGPRGRYYLDVYWSDWGLVVEVDGIQHTWAGHQVDDALRQNNVALSGATVIRLPLLGLRVAPDEFFEQIESALASAGLRLGSPLGLISALRHQEPRLQVRIVMTQRPRARLPKPESPQKPSLRSCLGSRCQSLAILTCRSR